MLTFKKTNTLQKKIALIKSDSKTVGFVPTMGNLHQGHLELIKQIKQKSNVCIVSIFVNPMQFNNKKDLANYPKTLENDIALLQDQKIDILFTPDHLELYKKGINQTAKVTTSFDDILEGKMRPGHFTGVATVILKFINIINPDIIAFGQKDWQQLQVIKKMFHDFFITTKILSVKTVRTEKGLALSSRNNNLNIAQRSKAPFFFAHLKNLADKIQQNINIDIVDLILLFKVEVEKLKEKLLKDGFEVDDINFVDAKTLKTITKSTTKGIILAAVFLGDTRLIDNILINIS